MICTHIHIYTYTHIHIYMPHTHTHTISQIKDKDTVYKQGFLVKQGGLVKSWKKRLFVLDYGGLSYYKTEQVRDLYASVS